MEKKVQKRSLFRILLLTAIAFFTGLAVLFVGLNASKKASGAEANAPVATIHLGIGGSTNTSTNTYYYPDFNTGWEEVVKKGAAAYLTNSTSYVRAVLEKDWVANADGFGTASGYYTSGGLYIPANTRIEIDLNNHKLDRHLTEGVENGQVIRVEGELSITDRSIAKGGVITGGYATGATVYGGGVVVNGGTLTMSAGNIIDNKVNATGTAYGVGVSLTGNSTFTMSGGTISGHKSTDVTTYGGGVYYTAGSTFTLSGGTITDNAATYGGGVSGFDLTATSTVFNLTRGTIANNVATKDGAGVYLKIKGADEATGTALISGGEISKNLASGTGAGIYVLADDSANLEIRGGKINYNVAATLEGNAYGGGVALKNVKARISGGTIEGNALVAQEATGGGVYLNNSSLTLTGGEIRKNRAANLADPSEENLKAVYAGLMDEKKVSEVTDKLAYGTKTYGGGIAVSYDSAASTLIMSGGRVHDNRANAGGGIYANGKVALSGGNIIDNYANFGGGVRLEEHAELTLSGTVVINLNYSLKDEKLSAGEKKYQNNLEIYNKDLIPTVGKFEFGASIHIFLHEEIIEEGLPFTKGYGENNRQFVSVDGKNPDNPDEPTNGVYAYANPYNYFVSDEGYAIKGGEVQNQKSEQHIVVLATGELGVARSDINFKVTYSDNSTQNFSFGDGDGLPVWNYVEYAYNSEVYPVKIEAPKATGAPSKNITENGKPVAGGTADAGVYTLSAKPGVGNTETEFTVIIKAHVINEGDATVTLSQTSYEYDESTAAEPTVTVKLGAATLEKDKDYTVQYVNNTNAGTAKVVVTFIKNYVGESVVEFTITPKKLDGVNMSITWETSDGDWSSSEALTASTAFTYIEGAGSDQSKKIRAKITFSGAASLEQTVYGKGLVIDSDNKQNTSMYLDFVLEGKSGAFQNAGTYTITIMGDSNYVIESSDRSIEGIKIAPMDITLTAQDILEESTAGVQLWQLKLGYETPIYTTLYDHATYYEDGEVIKRDGGSFARYRGVPMTLQVNENYVLKNGMTMKELLSKTELVMEGATKTGVDGKVTSVVTMATFKFSSNYKLAGSETNSIKLSKMWLIVSMVNELLTPSGDPIGSTNGKGSLEGWTFGNMGDQASAFAFRPEHGSTVIYSYYDSNGTLVDQFALKYSNNTTSATKLFYNLKKDNYGRNIMEADTDHPRGDESYLYTFNSTLRAGTYTVKVNVPQETQIGEHVHWWDGSTADDYGTKYYDLTYEFTFKVGTYALAVDGARNIGIEVQWDDEYAKLVEYTGYENNIAKPNVYLNGILLTEGVDYLLFSNKVTAGRADLRIVGINSLVGADGKEVEFTILNAFRITQATNAWYNVPSIMSWSYNGYNKVTNLITAKPILPLDNDNGMWFAIARDSEGTDVIMGLDHIVLDKNGQVNEEVVFHLNRLPAAQYYLVCIVEETRNYTALEPQPVPFRVITATNRWNVTPSLESWTAGKYKEETNDIKIAPAFGEAHILIVDAKDHVYYDSDNGINKLAKAKAGSYKLTAWVDGSSDYSELATYTFSFQVFAKAGLPWWAALIVAVGAVGIAALILFILWKKGVFQILTEKLVVSIRTRANIDATIASVRAAKMMEEGKQSVADAKRRERIEKMRQKAKEQREMSPEERAAQLEEKAKAEAARAERLRERSEATRAKAEKMRNNLEETSEGVTPAEEKAPEKPAEEKAPEKEAPAEEKAKKETPAKKSNTKKASDASKGAGEKPETPTED